MVTKKKHHEFRPFEQVSYVYESFLHVARLHFPSQADCHLTYLDHFLFFLAMTRLITSTFINPLSFVQFTNEYPVYESRDILETQLKTINPRPVGLLPDPARRRGGRFGPPAISETTEAILKTQTVFDSPLKVLLGNQISLTSGSPMMSQVRSNKMFPLFNC